MTNRDATVHALLATRVLAVCGTHACPYVETLSLALPVTHRSGGCEHGVKGLAPGARRTTGPPTKAERIGLTGVGGGYTLVVSKSGEEAVE